MSPSIYIVSTCAVFDRKIQGGLREAAVLQVRKVGVSWSSCACQLCIIPRRWSWSTCKSFTSVRMRANQGVIESRCLRYDTYILSSSKTRASILSTQEHPPKQQQSEPENNSSAVVSLSARISSGPVSVWSRRLMSLATTLLYLYGSWGSW